MRQMMSFLAGAMCGALVGTAAAILMAPASGNELREEIQLRFHTLVENAREAAVTKRAELEDRLANLKSAPPPPIP